ncbi:MAG: phosphorylase [Methylococcaceae bacterium]|nr:phosphorylase [Methylococcaceae bacterium]
MITGIVVALPEELSTLTARKIAKGQCDFINDTVLVALAGTGSRNAQLAAELLVAQGASQLISWGCAAALNDQLKPGDLTLAKSLVDTDDRQGAEFEISSRWQSHCQSLLAAVLVVHNGALATSKALVGSSANKKQLFVETGACAVDMESVAVAKTAKQHAMPFIAIRAIADPANMDLPLAISAALNTEGDVVLSKLLGYLVRHPGELPGLIKVGLQFKAAQRTLKNVAKLLNEISCFNQAKIV